MCLAEGRQSDANLVMDVLQHSFTKEIGRPNAGVHESTKKRSIAVEVDSLRLLDSLVVA